MQNEIAGVITTRQETDALFDAERKLIFESFWDDEIIKIENPLINSNESSMLQEEATQVENTLICNDERLLNDEREDIKEQLVYITDKQKYKTYHSVASYYLDVDEYYGYVDVVDREKEIFFAILHHKNEPEALLRVQFEFNDLSFKSDMSLLAQGVPVIWLVGHEMSLTAGNRQGTCHCVAHLIFRRTKVLSQREKEAVKKKTDEWIKFFKRSSIDG